jgi:hypothetical protein
MDVSPNALRLETVGVLRAVNEQIAGLQLLHSGNSAPPEVMAPLLLAKAQCLQTLVMLREAR